MDIQDLGAIGEFVSSIVIVVTVAFLVIEVRSSKQATLQSTKQAQAAAAWNIASATINDDGEIPNF